MGLEALHPNLLLSQSSLFISKFRYTHTHTCTHSCPYCLILPYCDHRGKKCEGLHFSVILSCHRWFLKSSAESILIGDGKPACDFPLQFGKCISLVVSFGKPFRRFVRRIPSPSRLCLFSARGTCLATREYDAEGPDELSIVPADRIIIVGLLVSCFDWFTGKKELTGEVGLVKTSLVKPSPDTYK